MSTEAERIGACELARNVISYIWRHPANRGKRARQVARAVGFQLRGRVLGRRTLTPIGQRSKMWAELHFTSSSMALYANPPDVDQMRYWRRTLKPGDLFLDVGANVGVYTLCVAELGAKVISVEPGSAAFTRLRENVALNGYDVELINAAVADRVGTVRFTDTLDTNNHLEQGRAGVEVRATTLDEILGDRHAAGAKVDAEGMERFIVEGARRALEERRIDTVQLEWNRVSMSVLGEDREPVAKLLRELGYELFRPDGDGVLRRVDNPDFGSDVFARPVSRRIG